MSLRHGKMLLQVRQCPIAGSSVDYYAAPNRRCMMRYTFTTVPDTISTTAGLPCLLGNVNSCFVHCKLYQLHVLVQRHQIVAS
jgi:hypothetical protein